jgi:VanZ family protein
MVQKQLHDRRISLMSNLSSLKILRAASWLIIFGLIIVTIVPADERPITDLQHDFEHFLAFALAGATFGLAYPRRLGVNLLSAVVFALVLELSQIPLPTRHARFEDFVVDAVACCLGILIAHGGRRLIGTWAIKPTRSVSS